MKIVYDVRKGNTGDLTFEHFFETDSAQTGQAVHPALGPTPLDPIHILKAYHDGLISLTGSGLDELSNHPDYPGKTRLEVIIAEIVRLNDAPARAILGV